VARCVIDNTSVCVTCLRSHRRTFITVICRHLTRYNVILRQQSKCFKLLPRYQEYYKFASCKHSTFYLLQLCTQWHTEWKRDERKTDERIQCSYFINEQWISRDPLHWLQQEAAQRHSLCTSILAAFLQVHTSTEWQELTVKHCRLLALHASAMYTFHWHRHMLQKQLQHQCYKDLWWEQHD